ncbi:MAG: glycosyltransferase family 39 protein [Thermoleophilia bacterium]
MSSRTDTRNNSGKMLAAILALATVVRLYALGRNSFYFDELYTMQVNSLPLGEMVKEAIAGAHPPLYHLLGRVWFSIWQGEVWARMLSAWLGVLAVYLTFLTGRELLSRRAGLWAALFMALSPLMVMHSRATTFYSLLFTLTVLSFYLLVRAAKGSGRWYWIGYAAATVALFCTYFYAVTVPIAGLAAFWFLWRRDENDGGRPRRDLMAFLACQALFALAALTTYVVTSIAISEPTTRLSLARLRDIKPLLDAFLVAPYVLFVGTVDDVGSFGFGKVAGHPWGHIAVVGLVAAAVAAAVLGSKSFRARLSNRGTMALFLFTAVLVCFPLTLHYANQGQLHGRFFAWAAPFLMLLIAAVVTALPSRTAVVAGVGVAAVLLSLTVYEVGFRSNPDADWRGMMAQISASRRDGDILYCFPLHNCTLAANYYLADSITIAGGIPAAHPDEIFFMDPGARWTGYGTGYWGGKGATPAVTGDQLVRRIDADLDGVDRFWLITTSGWLDGNKAIAGTIAAGWQEDYHQDYAPFSLSLYERRRAVTQP